MIRERELRLALICYGGVSLAVYMHGVTKELWKLLRASESRKRDELPEGDNDTEGLWRALLQSMHPAANLAVIVDILAGASAGGINAVLLSNAITLGHSLEPLTDMWLGKADVEEMLDPKAKPATAITMRLAQFYKEPVAWYAARQSATLASVDVPEVRAEVALKLASFVRSRWFRPPFSGDQMTAMLDDALDAMEKRSNGRPLVPDGLPIDLFVTVTDYWGRKAELSIHSPEMVTEKEHRRIFSFDSPAIELGPEGMARGPVASRGELLLAARATSSFPGAFPPAHIGEVDRRLKEKGLDWPERAEFIENQLASDRAPEDVALIDGSVLNNAPFGPAINAIRSRPAHREVDRRFVYIDPKPGNVEPKNGAEEPGFFNAMYRALADIPREQPIRDSLEAINAISARTRRLKAVTDAMTPAVDEAIGRAVGRRFFMLSVNAERVAKARSRIQSQAAKEAGFAFSAYAQLKLAGVLDEAAALLTAACNGTLANSRQIREALGAAALRRRAFQHDDATGRDPEQSGYVRLLKQLDIGFRVRRLRFFIRRLTLTIASSASPQERASAEALKAVLHRVTSPFVALRSREKAAGHEGLREMALAILAAETPMQKAEAAGEAIDRMGEELGLSALDADADRVLVEAVSDPGFGRDERRDLIRAWLGFPFYDIAILPLMQEESADSFEELKVDRISPDDAVALRKGGANATLKGWQLNSFAAFFSRAYRENDYLWGRLHAAERLVDIVASAVPEAAVNTAHWKSALFQAIIDSEEPRLTRVGPLFDELRGELEQWKRATG